MTNMNFKRISQSMKSWPKFWKSKDCLIKYQNFFQGEFLLKGERMIWAEKIGSLRYVFKFYSFCNLVSTTWSKLPRSCPKWILARRKDQTKPCYKVLQLHLCRSWLVSHKTWNLWTSKPENSRNNGEVVWKLAWRRVIATISNHDYLT